MKAILLAGGLGTRLRPLTLTCPKPLLPIGNLPLLHRIVINLRAHGIKEFVFLLHYKPELFIEALGNGDWCEAHFQHVVMTQDLSTAGSVKFAHEHITETTLIHSGDILADLPLRRMLAFHQRQRALATLALHPVAAPLPFGLVQRESDGRIRRFFEKPTWPQVFSDWINASIYLIEPELLAHIPSHHRPVFFEQEIFPPLAAAQAPIYGFPIEGYWRDVGTPEDLRLANMDYLSSKLPQKMLSADELTWHIPAGEKSAAHFVIGHGSKLAPDAQIESSVIGANCCIESHAKIHGAVIFDHVHLDKGVKVNNAILMRGVTVDAKAEIHAHAVLAEKAQIGAAAIIAANAVVRTEASVSPGEMLHAKRVLPTGYIRRFVDGGSLLGAITGGMSVALMRWVGKTFALRQAQQQKGKKEKTITLLLATEEEDRFSDWARALAQGMLAAGCEVHLLESVTLPLARWALQKGQHRGGIYLGADRHAELLRLAFMHPTAEDFTTEETCSLERIDLIDAPAKGNLRLLEAAPLREDYLRMVSHGAGMAPAHTSFKCMPLPHSLLNRPVPVRVGVVGQAAEQIVSNFFAQLNCPAQVEAFPLDMTTAFRRHTRAAQKAFVQSLTEEVGLGIWFGGVGERIQLALPGYGMLPRGRSDAVIARLLMEQDPAIQLVTGWLFPRLGSTLPPQIHRYAGCMLTAASLRAPNSETRRLGFDGRGAVAFPPAFSFAAAPANSSGHGNIAYPDALLAMAFLMRALTKISRAEFAAMIPGTTLGYRLMACPDEAKAYLMRRLVESYGHLECAFSDGIRLEDKNSGGKDWLVVRPCAGMPALEIYWEEDEQAAGSKAQPRSKFSISIRRQLARWRTL
ncbi:MAG: Glucose-1-phosphate adenylyltransferase [bacterium]|nr:Glucose-1-phosphate adenylyltransferase [bacterium]